MKISDGRDFGYASLNTTEWVYGRILSSSLGQGATGLPNFEINPKVFLSAWNAHQEWMADLNLAQFLGLPSKSALSRLPSWCASYPWATIGPREMKRWLPKRLAKIRRKSGFRIPASWGGKKIMAFEAKISGQVQLAQFQKLLTSVETNGFSEARNLEDPLNVDLLRRGEDECWVIHSGFHRTCVATAIGMAEIPAEVRLVVDRSQVNAWPQVKSGSFTVSEALNVFDALFSAQPLLRTKSLLQSLWPS